MTISKIIEDNDISNQNCFNVFWLKSKGLKMNFKITKLVKNKYFASFMNWLHLQNVLGMDIIRQVSRKIFWQ
jgi:hypothetical protein